MHVSCRKVWRDTHADFPKANYLLDELDLEHIFVSSDIDQSWINWREAFLSIMDLCIPHATLPTRKSLPWLTKTLINAMKKRNTILENQNGMEIYMPLQSTRPCETISSWLFVSPNKPFL